MLGFQERAADWSLEQMITVSVTAHAHGSSRVSRVATMLTSPW